MQKHLIVTILALHLLLSACAPAAPKPAPITADGQKVQLELNSSSEPEELRLYINAPIVDLTSGQPLQANVYLVESNEFRDPAPSELVQHSVDRVLLALRQNSTPHGQGSKVEAWLIVRAPGYEQWAVRLRYQITQSREFQGSVEMVRAVDDI